MGKGEEGKNPSGMEPEPPGLRNQRSRKVEKTKEDVHKQDEARVREAKVCSASITQQKRGTPRGKSK